MARQYSIEDVELSWATIDLKEGAPQGSYLTEAKTTQPWTLKPTGTGKIVRVYNPDESGQFTLNLDQESATHQALKAIEQLDRALRNQVFPAVMKDLQSGEKFIYENAFILNPPDESRGTDSAVFPWVFGYERKVPVPSDGTQNVVGS